MTETTDPAAVAALMMMNKGVGKSYELGVRSYEFLTQRLPTPNSTLMF
jgi:hypothetical protein